MKKILYEIRPAAEGFSGIPYTTRHLVEIISKLKNIEITFLINEINHFHIYKSIYQKKSNPYSFDIFLKSSRLPVNLFFIFFKYIVSLLVPHKLKEINFDLYNDLIWQRYFSKNLSSNSITYSKLFHSEYKFVYSQISYVYAKVFSFFAFRPRLNTKHYDYYICQTPPSYNISSSTKYIVVHHDNFPITRTDTIKGSFLKRKIIRFQFYENLKSLLKKKNINIVSVSNDTLKKTNEIFPESKKKIIKIDNFLQALPYDDNFQIAKFLKRNKSSFSSNYNQEETQLKNEFYYLALRNNFQNLNITTKTKFILFIGTVEPRKNIKFLIDNFNHLNYDLNIKLVIIGSLGWEFKEELNIMSKGIYAGSIIHLSAVPVRTLGNLVYHSEVVVSCSNDEGFNLPLFDARLLNKKVLCSDIDIHREILNGYKNVRFYKKNSSFDFCSKFREVLNMRVIKDNFKYDEYIKKITDSWRSLIV